MVSGLWLKIKEMVCKMLPKKTVEEVLHVTPCVSDRMANAIQLWADMYEGKSPWLREPSYEDPTRIVSLGLPPLIASEKARMVTLEMKSDITAPMQQVDMTQTPETSNSVPMYDPTLGKDAPGNTNTTGDNTPDSQANNGVSKPESDSNKVTGGQGITPIPQSVSPSTAFQQKTTEVPTGPTERAEFLNGQYKKLLRQVRRYLEYGIAKGGLVIKPYIVVYDDKKATDENATESSQKASSFASQQSQKKQTTNTTTELKDAEYSENSDSTMKPKTKLSYNANMPKAEIEFDFIQADRFFPLNFDANGKVVEAAFIQTKVDKGIDRVYVRVEYHKLEKRKVTVQNLAFESTDMSLANNNHIKSASNLGRQIPLTAVPEWASMAPVTVIEDCDRLLFAYFRMPEANTIDPYSPLGVSGYSRVIQLIKDADMQYSRLLWEYEGGELAIDVDRDALKFVTDPNGEAHSVLPQKQQRLFRKVDLNAEDTYNVFAPALRDVSIINGLNTILTRIEDATGLSRGTLSDVDQNLSDAKTATELKILKQRSFATNADIQMALQDALEDTIYVMDVYSTLYEVTPPGEYEVNFEWDDSIIVDSESELTKRLTLMQNGLASKLETRMWYYGETENQARMALQQVDEEATQAQMQNIQAEVMKSTAFGNNMDNNDEQSGDDSKAPADTTDAKKPTGKQADNLENPDKGKLPDKIKQK